MVCCGKSNGVCICAEEARCSCGARPAKECNCSKASTENNFEGATCSCGMSTLLLAGGDGWEVQITILTDSSRKAPCA
ncbi:uncharacterized protein V1513DRAFT_449198 [Lipomyces chichibuensis]|uniref:uncharacterized protein n=1 Tax=Lipomyces chichibuensis TaxID=1546026 RepID=UPI0033440B64